MNSIDLKKSFLQSIEKFNISINPFLTNSKIAKNNIESLQKCLKDLDLQYNSLITNNLLSEEEKIQFTDKIQDCRKRFLALSINSLDKASNIHKKNHSTVSGKRKIKGANIPGKVTKQVRKIINSIVPAKSNSKSVKSNSSIKQHTTSNQVIIGNNNEKIRITDLKRTNNNEFYNDYEFSELFDDNPIHFYKVERVKKLPNNIILNYTNELYGNLNMEKLEKPSKSPTTRSEQYKLDDYIRYSNSVQNKLLSPSIIEKKLLDSFGNIGYLKNHITEGYIPKYNPNYDLERKLNESYEKAFLKRNDNTEIKVFKVGTIDIMKDKKLIKQVDQYVLELQPYVDISNVQSGKDFISHIHNRYSNSRKMIVYGNIDFEKINSRDNKYISNVANHLLSDINLKSKYIGSVEPCYDDYIVNKNSAISNFFDLEERNR